MSFSNRSSSLLHDNNRVEQTSIVGDRLIDLKLTFGDDGGQDELLQLTANCFSFNSCNISQKQRELLKEIQSKQDVSNDTLLVFKFQVETGRQRQSLQFIEKGLDQDKQNENTSAMQKLFHRPKITGRIQLKQGKGYVYVIYRFYEEMIENHIHDLMKFVDSKIDFNFRLEMVMKGSTEQSKRSFTAVKPDYFQLKLQSQKLSIRDFFNFLQQGGQISQQQISTQYYQLLKNLQIASFDLKFNSVRQIMRYYYRCLYGNDEQGDEQNNNDYRQLPLLNKGIFKNSVSVNVILVNKLAMEVEVKYKSEEVMLRLIARFVRMYDTR